MSAAALVREDSEAEHAVVLGGRMRELAQDDLQALHAACMEFGPGPRRLGGFHASAPAVSTRGAGHAEGAQPPSMPAGTLVRLRGTVPSAQPPITAHSSRLIPAGGPHRPSAQGCHHQSQARHLRPQRPQPGRHSEADTQTVCRHHIGAGTVAQRPPAGHLPRKRGRGPTLPRYGRAEALRPTNPSVTIGCR